MTLSLSELQEQRRLKMEALRAAGNDPYPARTERTHTTAGAIARLAEVEAGRPPDAEHADDGLLMALTGRVVSKRHMGKTLFTHIRDGHGTLQLYIRKDDLGEEAYDAALKLIDLGDWVNAKGTIFRTKTGEPSLRVQQVGIISKALNAPPEKWHGLQDVETRYRQRYVDLIANEEVREVFKTRTRIVSAIRRILDSQGYLEVETPMLQPLYGGAAARPFTTHHNALGQQFYLRISDELYLKRLIVGGFERVYEIAKDFRNEGMDRNHSPEFTMIEFYEAFADYNRMMDLVEEMVVFAAEQALGSTTLEYQGHTVDLGGNRPFPRKTLRQAIIDGSGIDYMAFPDAADLTAVARSKGADIATGTVWPRVVDELLKQFVRPYLIQPIFLVDYPVELSPLAKQKPDDPHHVERFQLYVGGGELANAYSELNDPLDQYERFVEQGRDLDAGDEEAMQMDEDYVNALMYGMPPTGGVGIGIDRLTMLFTNQTTIRDVILFPAMRKLAPGESEESLVVAAETEA